MDEKELELRLAKIEDDIRMLKEAVNKVVSAYINHINGDLTVNDILTCAKAIERLQRALRTPGRTQGGIFEIVEVAKELGIVKEKNEDDSIIQIDKNLQEKLRKL